mmetsp:Transcript_21272/g.46961  ORF Transcript_21272/g.46961 Transcript_21272/m.46961 type:complete len:259 (-) Transcript_21272:61-837(-)
MLSRAVAICLLAALLPRRRRDIGLLSVSAQTQQCHERCTKCHLFDHSDQWHCLECEQGYDLWVDGCIQPCPPRQYRYGYNCENCTENCLQCVGPLRFECTLCVPGYRLDPRGLCVRQCEEGYYSTPDGEQCGLCNDYCKTCVSSHSISCTSCFQGYTLRVLSPRTSSGECMFRCPVGFYRDAPDDLRCIQCAKHCNNCSDHYTCFGCEEGTALYRGICYPNASGSLAELINFDTYLASGSGIQWNEAEKPTWEMLMER